MQGSTLIQYGQLLQRAGDTERATDLQSRGVAYLTNFYKAHPEKYNKAAIAYVQREQERLKVMKASAVDGRVSNSTP